LQHAGHENGHLLSGPNAVLFSNFNVVGESYKGVGQRLLIPPFPGSNPGAPASIRP
jgi:hypothetical protein